MYDDMCPHVKRVRVMALAANFFLLLTKGVVFLGQCQVGKLGHCYV